jgi:hypothetical protein
VIKFRQQCKNSKLRNIYFRLIHNDFFTQERRLKYKLTNSDKCTRCGQVENTKHLMWECKHVRNIWSLYNQLVTKNGENGKVLTYEQVYGVPTNEADTIIKIKIIQNLIQIDRPRNWTFENIRKLSYEILNIEKYNALIMRSTNEFEGKWGKMEEKLREDLN